MKKNIRIIILKEIEHRVNVCKYIFSTVWGDFREYVHRIWNWNKGLIILSLKLIKNF